MASKKYYSIGEVTAILKVHDYQLRYLEKILPNFIVQKIRDRRYYTSNNIEALRAYLLKNPKNTLSNSAAEMPAKTAFLATNIEVASESCKPPLQRQVLLGMVEQLIDKFSQLSVDLRSYAG